VRCAPLDSGVARIYTEADGEMLGTAPVEIAMTNEKITLLMPLRK
jgi:hypothetical protein